MTNNLEIKKSSRLNKNKAVVRPISVDKSKIVEETESENMDVEV